MRLAISLPFLLLLSVAESGFSTSLRAFDTPNDHGGSITVEWFVADHDTAVDRYSLLRAREMQGDYDTVAVLSGTVRRYVDQSRDLSNGQSYYYRLEATRSGSLLVSAEAGPVVAKGQWFHTGKTVVLVFAAVFSVLVLIMIRRARTGEALYVRPIGGIDAVDEATKNILEDQSYLN